MNDFEITTNNQEIVSIKVTNDLPSSIPNRSYVPTCTELERKFLDRIKNNSKYVEKLHYTPDGQMRDGILIGKETDSVLFQCDFPGIDLKELLK